MTYGLLFELTCLLVHVEHCLHLELVIELGDLSVLLHQAYSGVNLLLASTPVHFEGLPEILGVIRE